MTDFDDLCGNRRFYKRKNVVIGDGAEGFVYEACSKTEIDNQAQGCQYIVKEIGLYDTTLIDENAAILGIGPIVFIERCPERSNKTYLIQEKLDGNLRQYLETHKLTESVVKKLSTLVCDSINKLKIFHNDLHWENIMFRKGDKKGVVKFFLIDYTTAVPLTEIGWRRFDNLLDSHRFLDLPTGVRIPLISDENVLKIKKIHRPSDEYSKNELDLRKKKEQLIRKTRQQIERASRQRADRLIRSR